MNCHLCGLETGSQAILGRFGQDERTFCCTGCLHVYGILLESGVVAPGADFRQTDLFRRSLELGLVSQRENAAPAEIAPGGETREALFHLSGLWCSSCAWLIERAVLKERGIISTEVLFASDLLKVRYCPRFLPPERIVRRVEALGYGASEYNGLDERRDGSKRDLLLRAGVAFFLWMNVMYLSMVIYVGYFETISESARRVIPFVLMALTTPVIFYSAWPILRSAWLGLRQRTLRTDSLLALGILSAYGYSGLQAFAAGQHFYFDTACAIVTLVLAGKLLERGAKEKTTQAISFLYRMMPRKARLPQEGSERFVAVEALLPGTVFLVKTGERIPADGVIEEGHSHIDESVLTGESAPVSKRPGDIVAAGSLNTSGVLRVRATRAAAESTLSQIIRAVEAALSRRSAIERTVDKVARGFIPAVILIALVTFEGWTLYSGLPGEALIRAIAVLVIACPCALGIATPLALTAAVGVASRNGVLVNDVRVLETIRNVDVMVLDKTGTVTEGEFRLLEPEPDPLVASLEACSEHPLGRAVAASARERGVALQTARDIEVRQGMGITGRVNGSRVLVGNRRMFRHIDGSLLSRAEEFERNGCSTAFYGWGERAENVMVFGDRIRPDAAKLVTELRRRGVKTVIISGDSEAATSAVAQSVGVDEYFAEVLPAGKIEAIRRLQEQGSVVAMAGDGVNDAPALAQADLGIALGSGTDLAMKAAPMILMGNSLSKIPETFDLARKTLGVVRQNLFWAFFYNCAGISLAILGILNPILAAGAMVLSSVSVIGNSLRLSRSR